MKLKRVEGHNGLARDIESGAIVNINSDEAQHARERKVIRQQKLAKDHRLENDVAMLKDEIGEIKSLLKQLVENK